MTTINELKDQLMQTHNAVLRRKNALEELLESLKDTIVKMGKLSPEDAEAEIAGQGEASQVIQAVPARADVQDFSRLARAAQKPNTQFFKIAQFYLENKNTPTTVAGLADAIFASRSATTNILYRTQKEAFVSEKVPGHSRLMAWSLRPALYQKILQQASERASPSLQHR